jgi:hypothetical protein
MSDKQDPKIVWRKWEDPLHPMLKPYDPTDEESDTDYQRAKGTWADDDDDDEPRGRTGKYHNPHEKHGWTGPAIIGPSGIVPLHESNIPSKLWNFWMGDTNFLLTRGLVKAIARTPGVESIDVFSPYRFRIAIGRAFQPKAVRHAIDRLIVLPPKKAAKRALTALEKVKVVLDRAFSHWAMCVDSKDHLICLGGSSADEVTTKLGKHKDSAKHLIISWGTE